MTSITLKPHHFIAFFRDLGENEDPGRYTNGNDYKKAFDAVMNNPKMDIKITVGVDFICGPCDFLGDDNKCTATISGHGLDQPLQEWAVRVDSRLLDQLELKEGQEIKVKDLCNLCSKKLEDLKEVFCEEAKEKRDKRAEAIHIGLNKYLSEN